MEKKRNDKNSKKWNICNDDKNPDLIPKEKNHQKETIYIFIKYPQCMAA